MKIKYVAAGFKEDLESLFDLYLTYSSVRFCDFVKCWKKMKISLIFTCKLNQGEMTDFIEEVFRISLDYFREVDSAEKKIATLYFLYCFYCKQPLLIKVNIRLTLDELKLFRSLNQLCLTSGHLDTCYIWLKMLSMGAFYFVARKRQFSPLFIANNKSLPCTTDQSTQNEADKTFLEELSGQIEILNKINSDYYKMKASLEEEKVSDIKELTLVKQNLFDDFNKQMILLQKKQENY